MTKFLNLLCCVLFFNITLAQQLKLDTNYIIQDSVLITLPNGYDACLTIVKNANQSKQACVLYYNIYADSSVVLTEWGKNIVKRGYQGIIAHTRGKACSTNAIEPFEHDAEDAYYIIDWISKQSWCNGKIGMTGGSYLGFSQWAAVKHIHPALKAIVPQVAVGVGIDYPLQNGIFMSYMLRWIHYVTDTKLCNDSCFADEKKWENVFNTWYKKGLKFSSLDSIESHPNKIFQRWLQHPYYDAYWKNMTPQGKEFANINIPVLTITGYWDDDQLGALYYYKQHIANNKNANHYLVFGPYDHYGAQGGISDSTLTLALDSVARISMGTLSYKWFDHFLKDSAMPSLLKDKINFEIPGQNKWLHVPSLDKMYTTTKTFYLNNATLQSSKPTAQQFVNIKIDFRDRSKIKTTSSTSIVLDSIYHMPQDLVFTSEAITEETVIAGNYTANIQLSCNKKDVDIFIDLYVLLPNGKYIFMSESMQRASLAKNREKRQLLTPNKIVNIPLTETFTSCFSLQKGSKIVAVVGVNNNPNWQINYGTGKEVSTEDIHDAKEPLLINWYNTSSLEFKMR